MRFEHVYVKEPIYATKKKKKLRKMADYTFKLLNFPWWKSDLNIPAATANTIMISITTINATDTITDIIIDTDD